MGSAKLRDQHPGPERPEKLQQALPLGETQTRPAKSHSGKRAEGKTSYSISQLRKEKRTAGRRCVTYSADKPSALRKRTPVKTSVYARRYQHPHDGC